jgi:hypothetical protein
MGWLGALTIQLNLATIDRIGGEATGFVKARRPQPFIEAELVRRCWFVHLHQSLLPESKRFIGNPHFYALVGVNVSIFLRIKAMIWIVMNVLISCCAASLPYNYSYVPKAISASILKGKK